ncbi:fatty acyl-AMP ligase [Micromonospora echinospora]|uniref:fatty acyl-AMP ligase n=1 Tax=Micromonospora echinospora TaxID=1877 RepID=UPI003CEBCA02
MVDIRHLPDAVEAIRRWARSRPEAEALVWVDDPVLRRATHLDYAGLDEQARRIASVLQERYPAGSRVLLLYPPVRFVVAVLGALYAGMIAVPAPLPGRFRHEQLRVRGIAADADVAAILTDTASLPTVTAFAAESGLADVDVLATDRADLGDPDAWLPPRLDHGTLALLQYTSGSTGQPKGVMVTHGNLLVNATTMCHALGITEDVRFGGWAPQYHDMGLMAQTLPALFLGSACVLMDPTTFLKRPVDWLRMVDRYDIGWSPAPNFAYEYCVRRLTDEHLAGLDLSRWRYAVNGSEPVRAATMAAFAQRFAVAGFRATAGCPCYGLAEATVFVSGAPPRSPVVTTVDPALLEANVFHPAPAMAGGRALASNGVAPLTDVRVVDPVSLRTLPPGRVGEIWLRGPNVAAGYWRRADATAEVFGGTTAEGKTGFLRTGDLGSVHDGEIYVTGRLKETMIIRGRNIYPQDLEHELREQHPELANVGAVVTVPAPPGAPDDLLVLTHEVNGRLPHDDLGGLAARMRNTVFREFGVAATAVLLLRRGTVRRTTSGKIQRTTMRNLILAGELPVEYADVDYRWAHLIPVDQPTRPTVTKEMV